MAGFRRAQLRGSEELFTPTRTENGEPPATRPDPVTPDAAGASSAVTAASNSTTRLPEGRLVRLTDEEVQTLAEALQRLKFPGHKAANKPAVDEYERLEELRQKLLSVL
jgi:hypothetical protein